MRRFSPEKALRKTRFEALSGQKLARDISAAMGYRAKNLIIPLLDGMQISATLTMKIYERYLLPRIVNFTCPLKRMMKQREKVVTLARRHVLEIGIGSRLNLPFCASSEVKQLWGLDTSRETWALAQDKLGMLGFDVDFIEASAEDIPLDSGSADTVLITYTICTMPDVLTALKETRRVVKPDGNHLLCEHGPAAEETVQRWQIRQIRQANKVSESN